MSERSYKTGTGIRTIGTCDAEITGESSLFKYEERIYALYRRGDCSELRAGTFKLYRDGLLLHTYNFPVYWGYVYYWCQYYPAGSYKIVMNFPGYVTLTKSFTIGKEVPPIVYYNFRVFVRNQNNAQPISSAKVVYNGITKYTNSNGYTSWFSAEKDTTISYTISKSGFQTLTRSCYINRDNDECTPYLSPDCSCGAWVDGGCLRDNYRAQTRVCTPSGCDSEWREHYDPSCVTETHSCQIGTLVKPNTLKEGKEVTVKVPLKNTGNVTDKFDVQLIERDTGKVIDTEPDVFKKSIAPGATEIIEVNSIGWFGAMPNHPWNLDVKARRII